MLVCQVFVASFRGFELSSSWLHIWMLEKEVSFLWIFLLFCWGISVVTTVDAASPSISCTSFRSSCSAIGYCPKLYPNIYNYLLVVCERRCGRDWVVYHTLSFWDVPNSIDSVLPFLRFTTIWIVSTEKKIPFSLNHR